MWPQLVSPATGCEKNFMHPSVLVKNWVLENISSTVIRIYSVPSIVDVQQTGTDSEEAIEMSGCGRHSHVRGPYIILVALVWNGGKSKC